MNRRFRVSVCLETLAMFVGVACGPAVDPASTNNTNPAAEAVRRLAAEDALRHERSKRYFQRRLIRDGHDLHSSFGGWIAGLGLDGYKLQEMPIEEAYSLAHSTALRVESIAQRREVMLELFDETED